MAQPANGRFRGFSLALLIKTISLVVRPLLDVVYPPVYPFFLNLLLWLFLAVALPVAGLILWRRGEARERLVVILALSWLVGSPLGFSVTRGFLPAQFFSLLCIALALQRCVRGRRLWTPLLWGCLVAVGLANLQQVIAPSLRLYSLIPYPVIARDAVAIASQRQLGLIAISSHTLNALSIERFARPHLQGEHELSLIDTRSGCESFPRGTFVYVQLMQEGGQDSDPQRLCADRALVKVESWRRYVSISDLGYNRLWAMNLKDRGEAAAGAKLLIVTIPSG